MMNILTTSVDPKIRDWSVHPARMKRKIKKSGMDGTLSREWVYSSSLAFPIISVNGMSPYLSVFTIPGLQLSATGLSCSQLILRRGAGRVFWSSRQEKAEVNRCEWACFALAAGRLFIPTPPLSALSSYLPTSIYGYLTSTGIWPSYLLSPPWMFVLFEISCMLPRAINSHLWYQKTFGERYPKERKIVIPYLL